MKPASFDEAAERFSRYAAESVEQARLSDDPSDKTIHLNMALAWLRLGRQASEVGGSQLDDAAEPAHGPPAN